MGVAPTADGKGTGMPRRIDFGRAVLLVGSAALLISLFLEWYDTGPTGWQVFETLDLVLAALGVAGIAAALRPAEAPAWAAICVPGAALLIVAVQLIDAPPAAGGGDPSSGAWIALASGALMAAGAALSLADISVTVQIRERELRRRTSAVDRRGDGADEEAEADPVAPPAAPAPPERPPASRRLLADDPDADPDRTQPLSALPDADAGEVPPERP